MSTIHHDSALDDAELSAAEREWLERQGRAARALEARQRRSAAIRGRAALKASPAASSEPAATLVGARRGRAGASFKPRVSPL
jgi:hypothetical protein